MSKDGAGLGLELCQALLVALDRLGIALQTDTSLVTEHDDDVAREARPVSPRCISNKPTLHIGEKSSLPIRIELPQHARNANMPPAPVRRVFAKDIARRRLDDRRVLHVGLEIR